MLSAGGVLCVEELNRRAVDFEDRFLGTSHPRDSRFDWPTFRAGLRAAGFTILDERTLLPGAARSFLARR